jgi:predicted nucleotidyltransferase
MATLPRQRRSVTKIELESTMQEVSPQLFGVIDTGMSREEMAQTVVNILTKVPRAKAVYGFGSFFRGEAFRDIDLVLVVDAAGAQLMHSAAQARDQLRALSNSFNVPFDLTVFTASEMAECKFAHLLKHQWSSD